LFFRLVGRVAEQLAACVARQNAHWPVRLIVDDLATVVPRRRRHRRAGAGPRSAGVCPPVARCSWQAPTVQSPRPVPDFTAVRAEFALPADFTAAVLAEAAAAVERPGPDPDRRDATDVELVTIDPPGSKDLDQALGVVRRGRGFRVHYAIADLGAVVAPGGVLDEEVRRRGQTIYLPDGSVPLHPPVLSEDAASLLPNGPRAAVLWTLDLDDTGELVDVVVERAIVRSRARLDYAGVQADVDAGDLPPALMALPELGPLRRAQAVRRGTIELELPEQEVVPDGDGGWTVRVRRRLDVEAWNAEISLLTGMAAAGIMLHAGVGLLRTLPAPEADALAAFRRTAHELGLDWPEGASVAEVLAGLPVDSPSALALRRAATTLLRGVGYAAFDRAAGAEPPDDPGHGGIGAPYAYVTAPLRRLVDRFGTEVCLAVTAGVELPEWVRAALPELPEVMIESDALAGRVDRACLDRTEAALLSDRVGQEFDGVVLRPGQPDGAVGEVYVPDPPILAPCTGELTAGAVVRVRLDAAEPATGRIEFAAVSGGS
jgi:exoribonuclease R